MPTDDDKDAAGAEVASGPGPDAVPELVDRLQKLGRSGEEVTVGDLVEAFGAQGHAPLLMVVALLMIVPIGMIPGIGGALGLLAAAIGVQMIAGREGVWLPGFLRRRGISSRRVCAVADRVGPVSTFLARHLQERMERLAAGRVSLSVIAVVLIVAGGSLVVLGAVPVAVPLIGLPIAVFAIGIMARDGAVVAAGYALLAVTAIGLTAMQMG